MVVTGPGLAPTVSVLSCLFSADFLPDVSRTFLLLDLDVKALLVPLVELMLELLLILGVLVTLGVRVLDK